MQTHVINVRLRITARDNISRADILNDLNKQLSLIQEQAPYRSIHGAGWWTNSSDAVTVGYANAGEQLEAEADPDYQHPRRNA